VTLLIGNGSGHEPIAMGFVGVGLLDANVVGDVFAAPSPDLILEGIEEVHGKVGTLLLVSRHEGDVINANAFEGVNYVDITATGKGRGFQGVVKRYGFGGGRASHGGGWTRKPGSIGMCEFPGRVFKGKKMPGQMGDKCVTTQNLKIVQIRPEENLILVKGSIPGAKGGIVVIKEALKKK
jgi:50S ribosomal protein uL3